MNGVHRTFLLRHAQSAHNAHVDGTPLTEYAGDRLTDLGREQARAAGEGIAAMDLGITSLLTSPANRARETAAALAGPLGLEPEVAEETYEIGIDEGFEAALERVRRQRAIFEVLPEAERPLLVTHGIFIRFVLFDAILGELFEEAMLPSIWHLASYNCGLTTFNSGIGHYLEGGLVPGWTCLSWMERPWDRP